jgi:hypothetical protein
LASSRGYNTSPGARREEEHPSDDQFSILQRALPRQELNRQETIWEPLSHFVTQLFTVLGNGALVVRRDSCHAVNKWDWSFFSNDFLSSHNSVSIGLSGRGRRIRRSHPTSWQVQ